RPTAAMRSPCTPTSARNAGAPLPSTTWPPLRKTSNIVRSPLSVVRCRPRARFQNTDRGEDCQHEQTATDDGPRTTDHGGTIWLPMPAAVGHRGRDRAHAGDEAAGPVDPAETPTVRRDLGHPRRLY